MACSDRPGPRPGRPRTVDDDQVLPAVIEAQLDNSALNTAKARTAQST